MSGERGNASISAFKASGLCTLPQVLQAGLGPFGVPAALVRPHMVPAVTHVTTGLLPSEDSPSDKESLLGYVVTVTGPEFPNFGLTRDTPLKTYIA